MHGNRGMYHEGWTAVTKHRTPWTVGQIELDAFEDDRWELYDTTSDWTQARDIAAEHPDRLEELKELFLAEAEKYDVLPLDDRFLERLIPELSGRKLPPTVDGPRPDDAAAAEDAVPNIKNTSFQVTASVDAPDDKQRRCPDRPGRSVRRLGDVPRPGTRDVRAQLLRRRAHPRQPRPTSCRQVRTRSRWTSPTTAAASVAAATCALLIDGVESGIRAARAHRPFRLLHRGVAQRRPRLGHPGQRPLHPGGQRRTPERSRP